MRIPFISLQLVALLFACAFTASAQEPDYPANATPTLALEPFFGFSKAFIPTKEESETKTIATGGNESSTYTTRTRDTHTTSLGLEGGARTRLQLHEAWGIKAETGFQQLLYTRNQYESVKAEGFESEHKAEGISRMLYFYQSLEANYQFNTSFSASAGGFAGTLLSSYQEIFSRFGAGTRDGAGLRDSRLGLQASLSYLHATGLRATLNLRQDLKSVYTSEAQLAGVISPTSLSLTLGYQFAVAR